MDKIKKETSIPARTGSITNPKTQPNRSYLEWANIEEIIPNPLNPRKNDAIKSTDMQKIIKKRGWEIPLTVYRKGSMYVVLSGHRRLFAARQAGIRQIPCYVVEAPKTHQEEIERIASAQSGQEDWDVWEWAKFTYERWIAWGKPGFQKFAGEINLSKRTVEQYCQILDYFPVEEIEAGIKNKTLAVATLHSMYTWIRDLKKFHPDLVEALSEDLIRRMLITKCENKKITYETLRKRSFVEMAKENELKRFFTQPEMSLEEVMIQSEFDVTERTFHGRLVSVGLAKKNIKNTLPKNIVEAKKAAEALADLQNSIALQLKEIERNYPDAVQKEDLFTWKKK